MRSSPNWNETVLIITYDEHGGFYDHVPPPAATPPDPPNPAQQFDFASYGIRVPAVVISPLIPKADDRPQAVRSLVDRRDGEEALQAAEFPHQTRRRGEHAGRPHPGWLTTPRTDAPLTLKRPNTAVASAASVLQAMPAATAPEKPNDLQNDLLALTRELGLPIPLSHVQAMSRAATADEAFNESLAHFNAFVDRTAGKRPV